MRDRVQHRLARIAARGGDLQRAHRLAGAAADDVGEGAADIDADIDRVCRAGHARSGPPPGWFRCLDSTAGLRSCRLPAPGRDDRKPRRVPTITRPACARRGVPADKTAPIHVAHAPSARRTLVLAACLMATFMAAVESSIVATAMPTIVADLGGFNLFSWVFAVYLLTQAVSIPVYGRLADIYGRKKVFYVGAGLFLVGSTLCGFAGSMVTLILFRALAGLRRRRRAADRHHDPRRHLLADRTGARAGPGVQRVRRRRRAGPVARRVPGRAGELATGVLGQSADRRGGDRHDRDIPATNRSSIASTASTIWARCC